MRVADGVTDKKSARCTKPLPGGTLLWAWDADPEFGEVAGEQWLTLLPKKWNPRTHKQVYSWRYDPRELGAARAPEADPRRQHARRVVDDLRVRGSPVGTVRPQRVTRAVPSSRHPRAETGRRGGWRRTCQSSGPCPRTAGGGRCSRARGSPRPPSCRRRAPSRKSP
eukprot:7330207-Prymnesium_polylepis.2